MFDIKDKKKWLIAAVVAAAAVALGWVGYAWRPGVPVRAVEVRVQTIEEFVDEQGETRLPDTYAVTMPFSGRVDREPIDRFREGTPVKQGEPVARIVAEDLELAVRRARAGLERLEAAVAEGTDVRVERTAVEQAARMVEAVAESVKAAGARIEASRANLEYAQAHLARTRELQRTGARTQEELDLALAQHAGAAAAYRQDQLTYAAMVAVEGATKLLPGMIRQYIDRTLERTAEVLRKQRDEAQAALEEVLLEQRRGVMLSPIDGVVLNRRVSHERLVPAGETLLEIGTLEALQVEADLLSIEVVEVTVGDPVAIYGPAVGDPAARGTVARIYPAGFTKLSALGVEQQRVKVVIDPDPADRARLLAERRMGVAYRVRVRITTAAEDDALVVPRSALFRGADGRWRVFAIRNGRAREQVVELGLSNDLEAEVVAGLEPGERVVDIPDATLSDGVRVTAERP